MNIAIDYFELSAYQLLPSSVACCSQLETQQTACPRMRHAGLWAQLHDLAELWLSLFQSVLDLSLLSFVNVGEGGVTNAVVVK